MNRWQSVSVKVFETVLHDLPMSLKTMALFMDERDSASAQPALVVLITPLTKHDRQTLKYQLETILNKGETMTQKISVEFMPGARGVDPIDRFTQYSLVIECQKG